MKVSDSYARHDAVATFNSDLAARTAVSRLRAAGLPDASISIARDTTSAPPPSEMPAMSRVFWSGVWWSAIGGAIGALTGLIVGALGWGVPGTPDNIAIQVASLAMFAHIVGALVGCYAALDTGDRFARKPDHHDTPATLVRVTVPAAVALSRAEHLLRESGATTIERSAASAQQARLQGAGS